MPGGYPRCPPRRGALSHLLPGGGGQRLLQELPEPRVRRGGRDGAEGQGDGEQGQGALEAARQHLAGGSGAGGGGGRRWRLRCGSAPALGISSPPAAFINPSPDVKAGAPPSPHAAGGGSLGRGNGTGDAPLCPAPAKPPRFPLSSPPLWPPPVPVPNHRPDQSSRPCPSAPSSPASSPPERRWGGPGCHRPPAALTQRRRVKPPSSRASKAPRPGAGSLPVGAKRLPNPGSGKGSLEGRLPPAPAGGGGAEVPLGVLLPPLPLWVAPAPARPQAPSRGQLRGQREPPGTVPGSCRGSAAPGGDHKSVPGSGRAGPWLSLRGPLLPSQGRWTCWSLGMRLSHSMVGHSSPLLQPLL